MMSAYDISKKAGKAIVVCAVLLVLLIIILPYSPLGSYIPAEYTLAITWWIMIILGGSIVTKAYYNNGKLFD